LNRAPAKSSRYNPAVWERILTMSRRRRFWLCIPPMLLCLLDGGLTLASRGEPYWSGVYATADEANPLFKPILQWHPLAFVAAGAMSLAAFSVVIVLSRIDIAVLVSFCLSLGHAIRAAGWCVRQGNWGWVAACAILLAAERVTRWAWKNATRAEPADACMLPRSRAIAIE
jgi:hypothetical protein